jgi:hypothetical protein
MKVTAVCYKKKRSKVKSKQEIHLHNRVGKNERILAGLKHICFTPDTTLFIMNV